MNDAPKTFLELARARAEAGPLSTDEVLASALPLLRQVIAAHARGKVAPLAGLRALRTDGLRLFYEEAGELAPREAPARLAAIEPPRGGAIDVVAERERTIDLDAGTTADRPPIAAPGAQLRRPLYLAGYESWEHAVGHHDPLTDIFSLGLVLAALALGLDLADEDDLETFVRARGNLFTLRPELNPVLAKAIVSATQLERHRRAQDLPGLARALETHREQQVDLDLELARIPGFREKDASGRRRTVLSRLRTRLFEVTRRNPLLHFRPTLSTVNLTLGSVPLLLDVRAIRPEQLLTWHPELAAQLLQQQPIPLNRYLRFEDAPWLAASLDKLLAEARRDQAEVGIAQLRLVIAFLRWSDLKNAPAERLDSPLLLLPVKLTKKRGVRDAWVLQAAAREAEVNPVLRHHLKELYGIALPESVDLGETTAEAFHAFLVQQIRASEPGVTLALVDRPVVELVHERARRRLDQHQRRLARAAGPRQFQELPYSYDRADFRPLGVQLFLQRVRPKPARLGDLAGGGPRRARGPLQMVPGEPPAPADVSERARKVAAFRTGGEGNPYAWEVDLCALTLGNFRSRRMSLVRDYDVLFEDERQGACFDAVFSLQPRPGTTAPPAPRPLLERLPVVACDPTQAEAIELARAGTSAIIQGPPGTGKSQTITNLIADFVARGKRVLFVCEKRAALDVVFHRLQQQGLDELCCLIHDAQEDKKPFVQELKRVYEAWLAEPAPAGAADAEREACARALAAGLEELAGFDAAMRAAPPAAGLPVRELLGRGVELREAVTLPARERERLPRYAAWVEGRAAIERLRELVGGSVVALHPLAPLAPSLAREERPAQRLDEALRAAQDQLGAVAGALAAAAIAEDAHPLAALAALQEHAGALAPLARRGLLPLLDAGAPAARELSALVAAHASRVAALEAARVAARHWKDRLPPDDTRRALEQARALGDGLLTIFQPAHWRLRKVVGARYDFAAHAVRPSLVEVLAALDAEHRAAAAALEGEAAARARFGFEDTLASFAAEIAALRARVAALAPALRAVHAQVVGSADPAAAFAALAGLDVPLAAIERALAGVVTPAPRTPAALRALLASLAAAQGELSRFLPCLLALGDLPAPLAAAVREVPLPLPALEAGSVARTLDEVFLHDRAAAGFSGAARAQRLRAIEQEHGRWHALNARAVRERVRARFLERVRRAERPAEGLTQEERTFKKRYAQGRKELEHELGKSMRYRSIRELSSGPPREVIADLKPVWLMSPLSISDTLPLDEHGFDVVVFDEASQVPLEEAVPSLFRAPQVIVVGDPMQLPPTSFFAARQVEDDALVVEEGGASFALALDQGSLLAHAARNLPTTMLGWHYRSRSESLIGFSNSAFYERRLLTVPEHRLPGAGRAPIVAQGPAEGAANAARVVDRPVSFHALPNAVYLDRKNADEAAYVAELVRALTARPERPTLAVIAFSEAQQSQIETALQALADQDADFRARLEAENERVEDGQFCGLLVKNLENIQGDERDIVLLSICYGPGADRRVLMNFGPINQAGGEKRLNVAFSRAKRHMAVVSSLREADITNVYNDGARCLREYLAYAAAISTGDPQGAEAVLRRLHPAAEGRRDGHRPDAVAAELAARLRARGWLVDAAVGQSRLRCDLAIRKPGAEGYALAIQIDTEDHYRESDLLARDLLRPQLLRAFGWRVTQVLAKDWLEDPDAAVERLEAAAR